MRPFPRSRPLAVGVIVALAAAGFLAAQPPPATTPAAAPSNTFEGFTRPSLEVTVGSRVEGIVAEVLVKEGQTAWIRIHGRGYNNFKGRVVGVSGKEATEIPLQFSKNHGGDVVTEPLPEGRGEKPINQLYLVTVDFTEMDDGIQPGVMSRCKIIVEPKTLFWRLRRYLSNTFNLGL